MLTKSQQLEADLRKAEGLVEELHALLHCKEGDDVVRKAIRVRRWADNWLDHSDQQDY